MTTGDLTTTEPVTQPIDPAFGTIVEMLASLAVSTDTLGSMRDLMAQLLPEEPTAGVERTEHVVDEATGVRVRVHRPAPAPADPLPCVYSIHGGGYVLGSYDMDDLVLGDWCRTLGIVGVSVEYRLAPEHPYPVPLEDCYAGLRWTHEHADELGIDATRIGIGGVSAGGGLAAALALLARERGELSVAFQLLDSPMLDDRQCTPSSRIEGLAIWSRESNGFGWRSYLGELYGRDDLPPTAAPARAVELAGLPPAFVCVGTVDGFRDEDIDYALRLNQAGVPTELHVYPGAPHGFALIPDARASQHAAAAKAAWLADRLAATERGTP
jgi:acetyl esterase/lipase